jgi:hypothetical protein
MDNPIGPIDYGTTNMFVKQTVKRAREAQSFGLMPYQRVILVLADRVEALEQIIAGRAAPETIPDEVEIVAACGSMNALGTPCDRPKGHSGLHDWEQP